MLRCFPDALVGVDRDPLEDYSIIVTELMLKDLDSVDKRLVKASSLIKAAKGDPKLLKELESEVELLKQLSLALNDGQLAKVQSLLKESHES